MICPLCSDSIAPGGVGPHLSSAHLGSAGAGFWECLDCPFRAHSSTEIATHAVARRHSVRRNDVAFEEALGHFVGALPQPQKALTWTDRQREARESYSIRTSPEQRVPSPEKNPVPIPAPFYRTVTPEPYPLSSDESRASPEGLLTQDDRVEEENMEQRPEIIYQEPTKTVKRRQPLHYSVSYPASPSRSESEETNQYAPQAPVKPHYLPEPAQQNLPDHSTSNDDSPTVSTPESDMAMTCEQCNTTVHPKQRKYIARRLLSHVLSQTHGRFKNLYGCSLCNTTASTAKAVVIHSRRVHGSGCRAEFKGSVDTVLAEVRTAFPNEGHRLQPSIRRCLLDCSSH